MNTYSSIEKAWLASERHFQRRSNILAILQKLPAQLPPKSQYDSKCQT